MLPGSRRIRRAEDFRSVIRMGRRVATRTVVLHVGPLTAFEPLEGDADGTDTRPSRPARAGFVVGRSVARSAVVRNRVVRRLRHIMAGRLGELPEGTGVVVRALPAAASASWDDLCADVDRALGRCLARLGPDPEPASTVSR